LGYWCKFAPQLTLERRLIAAEYYNNIHTLSEVFRDCICEMPDDAEALYRLIGDNFKVHFENMTETRRILAELSGLEEPLDKMEICDGQ
jgi:hypothetical protein